MKFISRFKLKKVLLISLVFIIVFVIVNVVNMNYFYKKNNEVINNSINNILERINEYYPDVDEEDLIKILNSDNLERNNVLNKYGIDLRNSNVIKVMESNYKNSLLVSNVVLFGLGLFVVFIFMIDNYIKSKEINNIIKTIKKVNDGVYELEINDTTEGDLALLKDELYKITLTLREKAEISIKDKNILKDNISNISHQIKTPLTSMLIMIDNLIDNDMDKKLQEEFLFDVRKQIENINFLIIALLKLSRLEANVIEFKKDNINVKELMFNVCKNVSVLSDIKNIDISLNGKNDVFFIGDYQWELEAITNILKNCIEHSIENKRIIVRYEENYFFTKIVIEDFGKGINDKDIGHIFERFYKGEDSDSNSIGIGLALAKEIVEKDNGSITVSSKKDNGTKFIIKYFK